MKQLAYSYHFQHGHRYEQRLKRNDHLDTFSNLCFQLAILLADPCYASIWLAETANQKVSFENAPENGATGGDAIESNNEIPLIGIGFNTTNNFTHDRVDTFKTLYDISQFILLFKSFENI